MDRVTVTFSARSLSLAFGLFFRRWLSNYYRLNARVEEFRAFPAAYFNSAAQQAEIDTLLGQYQSAFSSFVEESLAVSELTKILSARYAAAEPMLSSLREQISQQATEIGAQSRAAQQDLVQRSALAGVCGLLVFVLLAVILSQRIAGPLLRVKTVLEHMLDGELLQLPHGLVKIINRRLDSGGIRLVGLDRVGEREIGRSQPCFKRLLARRELAFNDFKALLLCVGELEVLVDQVM